jgi:hypothetical protein
MFSRRNLYLIVAGFLIWWTIYMYFNREHFIIEHLSNQNPTLFSLQTDLDATNEDIKELRASVDAMKQQGMAQSNQAAGALASLQAIPAGSPNTIIPTR